MGRILRPLLVLVSLVATACGPTVHYPPKDTAPQTANPGPVSTDPNNPVVSGRLLADWVKDLKSPKAETRKSAAIFLGNKGAKYAVPPLIDALRDQDATVRRAAARSLGIIGPDAKDAIMPLIGLLRDSDDLVKGAAGEALGEIGKEGKAAVPALTELYKSNNFDLRGIAGGALKKIDPEAAYQAGVPRP